jgi:hypothetical protein
LYEEDIDNIYIYTIKPHSMNNSLNELAESIAERAGRQYDIPFREQCKLWIGLWRAKLLRDTLESNPKDRAFFLTSAIFPLEVVKDYPGCGIVKRTVCKVPQPLRANGILFDYVGSVNMTRSFPIIPSHSIPFLSTSSYTGANPKVVWIDNYLYVFNAPLLAKLRTHGVYEDLSELYNTCATAINGNEPTGKCLDDDSPYPVTKDIAQRIIQSILSTELRIPVQQTDTEITLNPDNNEQPSRK